MEQIIPEQNLENSDTQVNTGSDTFRYSFLSSNQHAEMKEELFYYWYSNRRTLTIPKMYDVIKEQYSEEEVPPINTFRLWIREYVPRARELDLQVHNQIEAAVIAEKVEMLKRHAGVGVVMQNLAMEYIKAHADDLTSAGAIRLLVEGVRIERESKGVPEALEKMSKMTDEDLLNEVKKLATSSSVTLEKWDADRYTSE